MSDRITILRNAYDELDNMPISFGLTGTDENLESEIGGALNKALMEMGWSDTTGITSMSKTEYYITMRTVWHILRRFKNSASVYFKYSTGNEGKSVDKSMIPKMIGEIMNDYDAEFKAWKHTTFMSTGSLWNMTRSDNNA